MSKILFNWPLKLLGTRRKPGPTALRATELCFDENLLYRNNRHLDLSLRGEIILTIREYYDCREAKLKCNSIVFFSGL